MLTWYEPLYLDGHLRKREKSLRKRLNEGRVDVGHYLITLSSNPADNLDIISTSFLVQPALYDRLPMVVGLASSKKEAMRLVLRITDDCLSATGGADLRAFLLAKQEDGDIY